MPKVVKLVPKKDKEVFQSNAKIEGEYFHKIKACQRELKEFRKSAEKEHEALHNKLWDTVYAACPELDKNKSLELIMDHEKLGLILVAPADNKGPLKSLLRHLVDIDLVDIE